MKRFGFLAASLIMMLTVLALLGMTGCKSKAQERVVVVRQATPPVSTVTTVAPLAIAQTSPSSLRANGVKSVTTKVSKNGHKMQVIKHAGGTTVVHYNKDGSKTVVRHGTDGKVASVVKHNTDGSKSAKVFGSTAAGASGVTGTRTTTTHILAPPGSTRAASPSTRLGSAASTTTTATAPAPKKRGILGRLFGRKK